MNLGVPLLLVRSCELSAALVARERLLARVRPNVRGQVIGAREAAHANPALERLLAGVDADVARELVRAREASIARVHRAGVPKPVLEKVSKADAEKAKAALEAAGATVELK